MREETHDGSKGRLWGHYDAEMVAIRSEQVTVKPSEVATVEREQASLLLDRKAQLFLIRAPAPACLRGSQNIETAPAEAGSNARIHILVQVDARTPDTGCQSRTSVAPSGAWSDCPRRASISSR